jgi:hypothetical protein
MNLYKFKKNSLHCPVHIFSCLIFVVYLIVFEAEAQILFIIADDRPPLVLPLDIWYLQRYYQGAHKS